MFALTPFQQQAIFKTSKVSRIRIRIYHVNIAHAQSARRTRTDGRTDARAVDIINGGARLRSPQLYTLYNNSTYDVQRSSIRKRCSAVQKLPFYECVEPGYKKGHISVVARAIDSKCATKVHRTMHKRNTVLTRKFFCPFRVDGHIYVTHFRMSTPLNNDFKAHYSINSALILKCVIIMVGLCNILLYNCYGQRDVYTIIIHNYVEKLH